MLLESCAVAILLSFSFNLFEGMLRLVHKQQVRFAIYYWGAAIIALSFLWTNSYTFSLPSNVTMVFPLFLVILLVNLFISRSSGYSPQGSFNNINFFLAFPILEEIAFRGLVLPILARHPALGQLHSNSIIDLSWAVILTSLLFAVSHLQYYKLNRESIRFMVFAFSGGIFFGSIAQVTGSVLLTIPLHIAFNASAVLYAKAKTRQNPET